MHLPNLKGGKMMELTNERISKLTTICRGWARARHIERIYYLAAPRVAPTVERAAKKANALDRIWVLPVEDTAGLAERELAIERALAPGAAAPAGGEGTDARF
jgi:hypothetical protein